MRKSLKFLAFQFMCVLSVSSQAQAVEPESEGGAYPMQLNNAEHPCITPQEYAKIERVCIENRKLLGLPSGAARGVVATSLSWPLRAATNLTDCSYYAISAGVDHDTTTGNIKDYNCGIKTYDGHMGTDIPTYPYHFYKMDNNQVEVIAAAAGTILYREDGNFDKNCGTNSLDANAIIIAHADGSQSHYWHMKSGSVTSKAVGQTVATGEYLGVVGSSGNSTGPHLHFEVWSGSTQATLIDPFSGTCNQFNANSWWASQKPYNDPTAIKVSVNTTDLVSPACPGTETPNESNSFTVPFQGPGLTAGYAKFYLFMRDETPGDSAYLSILNPNGSVFNSWTYKSNTTYDASYRAFSKLLPTVPGVYTFKGVYNGTVCTTAFTINTATGVNELNPSPSFDMYPNPASNSVNINVDESLIGLTLSVTDLTGRKVTAVHLDTQYSLLNTETFPNGVYFVTIGNRATKKLIINK